MEILLNYGKYAFIFLRPISKGPSLFIWNRDRAKEILDVENLATQISFGAVLQNIRISAREINYDIKVKIKPYPEFSNLFLEISFVKNLAAVPEADKSLSQYIEKRHSERAIPKEKKIWNRYDVKTDPYLHFGKKIFKGTGYRTDQCNFWLSIL